MTERAPIDRWPEVVGSKMAVHTRAVDIKDKVLILEADHGAWRQEVTLLIPMIIQKYNALFGEDTVKEIMWRDRPMRSRHGRRQG
jgi:predicted nucleic acid-binding Zn ribbon protein